MRWIMHSMISGMDLNLLTTLDALLHERSVSAAGRRTGLSQPATSAALRRLRAHFDDPLLVRSGGRYELTPLAESLAEQLGPVLEATTRLATTRASSTIDDREFAIVMADSDAAILAAPLLESLRSSAPRASLRIDNATVGIRRDMRERLRLVDGSVLPHRLLDGLPCLDLFEERWVCLADADNARLVEGMSAEELGQLSWVTAFERPPFVFSPLETLRARGVAVRIAAHTEAFATLPALVRGTEHVALIPSRMAPAPSSGFRTVGCALLPQPYALAFAWHPVHERQPQHRELRQHLAAVAATIPALAA